MYSSSYFFFSIVRFSFLSFIFFSFLSLIYTLFAFARQGDADFKKNYFLTINSFDTLNYNKSKKKIIIKNKIIIIIINKQTNKDMIKKLFSEIIL